MTPAVVYELTIEDMRALRNRRRGPLAMLGRVSWYTVVLFAATGGLAATTLWLHLHRHHPDVREVIEDAVFAGGGWTAALVLSLLVYERGRRLRQAEARLVALGPIEMRGDDTRLEVRQGDLATSLSWASIAAIEEAPAHLFVRLGPERMLVVPRAAVAATALGALLAEKARGLRGGSPAVLSQ